MADLAKTRPTSVRAQDLAERFEAVNAEIVGWVRVADANRWDTTTSAEGWPVPAAAMHIALSHLSITPWVHRISRGLPVTETLDDFAVMNAVDAKKYADTLQRDAVEHLTVFGAAAARFVRGLTDEELDASARFAPGGVEITAARVVERVLIGHAATHFASMQAPGGPGERPRDWSGGLR